MSPRVLAVVASLLFAGCNFHVDPVAMDLAVPSPSDDLGVPSDLAQPDLFRPIPDGATPRGPGWPCDDVADCNTGACVDHYCCDSACDPGDPANRCKACNVPGSEGHCVNALAGTDPHQHCEPDPVAGCGKDGLCDGAGGCRLYPAGTVCGAATCANDTYTSPPACDGAGACVPGAMLACAPYTCNAAGSACRTDCTPPANGCQAPATCDPNGSCGKKALGMPCGGDGECTSNHCVDGVCCDTSCASACHACNLPGKVGTCSPEAAGTVCAAAACNGDSAVAASACTAGGTCPPPQITDCTPYTCNNATKKCFGRPCSNSNQCAAGHTCNSGSGKCM